jgi:dihydroxyacetone kinase
MELHIMNRRLAILLKEKGIVIHDMDVNSYITCQEMAGASVSILKLDDEIKKYYDAPCDSPYYKKL